MNRDKENLKYLKLLKQNYSSSQAVGSPKACKENIEYIMTPLKHGLGILSGRETN